MDNITLKHYRNVAHRFGLSAQSTMKDSWIRERESQFIDRSIEQYLTDKGLPESGEGVSILDIGCGNGHTLEILSKKYPGARFYGVEYTPELFELAKSRNLEKVKLIQGDFSEAELPEEKMDLIITQRVLINILHEKKREESFKRIYDQLKDKGYFICIESFKAPLYNLNLARKEMKLGKICQSIQNRYLTDKEFETFLEMGLSEIEGPFKKNDLSTHFYNTRVFHHLVRPKRGKLEETEFVKFFDEAFGPAIGNYSPILFHLLQKR
jgi:ubiquinone/menaquinone biosynthesis C-methylase UbiE